MPQASRPILVKEQLAESDDMASTDAGSDHHSNSSHPVGAECAATPMGVKEGSSMGVALGISHQTSAQLAESAAMTSTDMGSDHQVTALHALGPADETLAGSSHQKKTRNKKQAATAPNPEGLPNKRQLRRGGKALPVSTLRSTLRNKGAQVMNEMSASSHQPSASAAAWLEGAASVPLPPRVERKPLPVPDLRAPNQMANDWNKQLCVCVPTVCYGIRRANTPSSNLCMEPSYTSWVDEADLAPVTEQLAPCFDDSGNCWLRL